MKNPVLGAAIVVLGMLGGCRAWLPAGKYSASIDAPATVNRGEDFRFTVTLKDDAGREAPGLSYDWRVDWVDLPGIAHHGKSGKQMKIRVKGAPGTAVLRILATDPSGNFVEMASREFKVE